MSVGFGTSGLRGLAEGFSAHIVRAYVGAFLDVSCEMSADKVLWIGADLRASSPLIVARVAAAARAHGWTPRYAGPVPTPALAHHALGLGLPAIMVTGSHIPADYNGLKFYRPDGELLKSDEGPIRDAAAAFDDFSEDTGVETPGDPDPAVAEAYVDRFVSAFPPDALAGLRIGVFEHSAVGRDLLTDILDRLGATCVPFGRSAAFIAVDTEAVSGDHMAQMQAALAAHGLDAVVSTDGDGDRPLVLDETGAQINGDVLGALTARAMGAGAVVTPLTSTSGIEMSGWFERITRTRIGSPYVVAAMAAEAQAVVGFEANGGFLVGTGFDLPSGRLERLPTRDAVLPVVAVLADAVARGQSLSTLAAALPRRFMRADRLKNIAPEIGNRFVAELAGLAEARTRIDGRLADPVAIDTQDGTRLVLGDGTIVHFRQSGNAPEFRCYVETGGKDDTEAVLKSIMNSLQRHFLAQEG